MCGQQPVFPLPDFEIFHNVLHVPQLSIQPAPLCGDAVQLPAEVIDVGVKERLQVLPHRLGALLLKKLPLGLQDLVLLLQEPYLEGGRMKYF